MRGISRNRPMWPFLVLLLMLGLSACGQKGDLYLPEKQARSSVAAPVSKA